MKRTLKKHEMRGQFIDMQKTRGGIPCGLEPTPLTARDLQRIGIPYVIGRKGWKKYGKRIKPLDWRYIHHTDASKVLAYFYTKNVLAYIHVATESDKLNVIKWIAKYRFTFPRSYNERLKILFE